MTCACTCTYMLCIAHVTCACACATQAHELCREDFEACLQSFPDKYARIKKIAEERVTELKVITVRLAQEEQRRKEEQEQEERSSGGDEPSSRRVSCRRRSSIHASLHQLQPRRRSMHASLRLPKVCSARR